MTVQRRHYRRRARHRRFCTITHRHIPRLHHGGVTIFAACPGGDVPVAPAADPATRFARGCVTLTGEVEFWYQKDAAEQDIRPLHGVVGVWNQIVIKPRVDTFSLSDDITHALHRLWFFDPQTTHVRADGGTLVLSGTVHSLHEREIAAQTAWSAPGVISVENDITVV